MPSENTHKVGFFCTYLFMKGTSDRAAGTEIISRLKGTSRSEWDLWGFCPSSSCIMIHEHLSSQINQEHHWKLQGHISVSQAVMFSDFSIRPVKLFGRFFFYVSLVKASRLRSPFNVSLFFPKQLRQTTDMFDLCPSRRSSSLVNLCTVTGEFLLYLKRNFDTFPFASRKEFCRTTPRDIPLRSRSFFTGAHEGFSFSILPFMTKERGKKRGEALDVFFCGMDWI